MQRREGKTVYQNGDTYNGHFKNGKRKGMGISINTDGKYTGYWVDDCKQDQGRMVCKNGDVYMKEAF